jgi:hypothetical protein
LAWKTKVDVGKIAKKAGFARISAAGVRPENRRKPANFANKEPPAAAPAGPEQSAAQAPPAIA